MTAFAGESQARNKYTYYASKAKKEGYVQISKIFEETAANEKEHAELWFKAFHGIGTTYENLLDAAYGENYEFIIFSELIKDQTGAPLLSLKELYILIFCSLTKKIKILILTHIIIT